MYQCRYCLDMSDISDNTLINPCKCSGTVKYLHISCFFMWFLIAPEDKKYNCSICKSLYTFTLLNELEEIPYYQPIALYCISKPISCVLINHYFFIVFLISNPSISFESACVYYKINQIIYHSIYLSLFCYYVQIKKKTIYLKTLIKSFFVYLLIIQFACVYLLLISPEQYFILSPISNLLYQYYWLAHTSILVQMNRELINPYLLASKK